MPLLSSGTGVDDVYISVNPPQAVLTNAQDTYNLGLVGAGSWGPVNVPVSAGTPQDLVSKAGPPINSGHDIVQDGVLFLKQGPQGGIVYVRVTDGTDTAATGQLNDTAAAEGAALTGKSTGTFGNQINVELDAGSNSVTGALSWKVIVRAGKFNPEVIDNIAGNTGALAWPAIIAAINANSNFVTAALPGVQSTSLPSVGQKVTLTGGHDGATGLTTAQLLGADGAAGARTGMYALRGSGVDAVILAGCKDSASFATLDTFAQSENSLAFGSLGAMTPATAVAGKNTAGVADANFALALGTVTYLDTYLGTNVTLPSAPVLAGIALAQDPEQPTGNRQAFGLLGTDTTMGANPQPYASSDMALLEANGILFLANPIPMARSFGARHGKNTSSNAATSEICYTRKLNSLIRDLQGPTLGQFVNRLQTTRDPDPTRTGIEGAVRGYLGPQKLGFVINDYDVQCNLGNNPVADIQAGKCRVDIVVVFMAVTNRLIANLTAGQSVSIVRSGK